MDNAKGNKCKTVYAGLASLVALGVCQKLKLSYGEPNHGHTDVDATIASVIAAVALQNLPTLELFEAACIKGIQEELQTGSHVISVSVGKCVVLYDTIIN